MRQGIQRLLAFCALSLCGIAPANAIEKIPPDAKVLELVNKTLTALNEKDEAARVKALLPLVHKSLKNAAGDDLTRNIKDFSFKKASVGAPNYASPVTIFEVHKGNVSTVGFKETAQKCRRDKYFINVKEGTVGRPAPIHVCLPEDGTEPTILDFGSLN